MRALFFSLLLVACGGPMVATTTDAGTQVFGGAGGSAGGGAATAGGAAGTTQDAGSMPDGGATMDAGTSGGGAPSGLLAARPYTLRVPAGADGGVLPLVVLLHGYGATGAIQTAYFGFATQADRSGFLLVAPDGTVDAAGKRFWNATDACCNFLQVPVDDVAYVRAIIDDVSAKQRVDEKRIFIVGHSNGGFMTHRLACELAPRVAAVASFAGAGWKDASRCQPAGPVSVLQIHGTMDETVDFLGGAFQGASFPSAVETQTAWATRNGCGATRAPAGTLDLVSNLAGDETTRERFPGCTKGDVELWTIAGGTHIPSFNTATWSGAIWEFLSTHPRP
jgi:polyhydroxybutyrate depolymerase